MTTGKTDRDTHQAMISVHQVYSDNLMMSGLIESLADVLERDAELMRRSEEENYIDTGEALELIAAFRACAEATMKFPGLIRFVEARERLDAAERATALRYADAKAAVASGDSAQILRCIELLRDQQAVEATRMAEVATATRLVDPEVCNAAVARAEELLRREGVTPNTIIEGIAVKDRGKE